MLQLKDNFKSVSFTVSDAPDSEGNAPELKNILATSSDETLATVSVAGNVVTALPGSASEKKGSVVITVSAEDADGNKLPDVTVDLNIVAQNATSFSVVAGEPAY